MLSLVLFSFCCYAQDNINEIENSIPEGVFKVIQGKIYSKEPTEKTFLILINSNSTQPDFNDAFILFSEKNLPAVSFSEADNYAVIIPKSKAYVLLINKNKCEIAFIGISNNFQTKTKESIASNPKLKDYKQLPEYSGYGLSYNHSTWDAMKVKKTPYHLPYNILHYADKQNPALSRTLPKAGEVEPNETNPKNPCTSGGGGATQCSIDGAFGTGCSVTCSAGYYACCDDNKVVCYCVKNPS